MSSKPKQNPIPPFKRPQAEWRHARTEVLFHSPSREVHPDSRGVPTEVVVWTATCKTDRCNNTFKQAHRLPPAAYPQGMPTPQMMAVRMTRKYCEHCARTKAGFGGRGRSVWDNPETCDNHPTDDGREWVFRGYEEAPTLTGETFTAALWEGPCIVPDCHTQAKWTTTPTPEGKPKGTPPKYCHNHTGGGRPTKPTPAQAAWFAEKKKAQHRNWLAGCAAARARKKELLQNGTPEERQRAAAEQKAAMQPWLDACAAGRAKREELLITGTPEEKAAILAQKEVKKERWLKALADSRARKNELLLTGTPEEKAAILAEKAAKKERWLRILADGRAKRQAALQTATPEQRDAILAETKAKKERRARQAATRPAPKPQAPAPKPQDYWGAFLDALTEPQYREWEYAAMPGRRNDTLHGSIFNKLPLEVRTALHALWEQVMDYKHPGRKPEKPHITAPDPNTWTAHFDDVFWDALTGDQCREWTAVQKGTDAEYHAAYLHIFNELHPAVQDYLWQLVALK